MADLKVEYIAIEESIKGIRADGTTRSEVLLLDTVEGDTIVRALAPGGTVLFQDAAGAPIAFPVAWGSITSKPTTIAGYAISDAYTEAEIDALLAGKSDTGHVHTFASLTSKPTTVAGYGITDAYTKAEADALLAVKVPTSRTVSAGTGLSGGGDLSANRSLAFDTTWGDARYSVLAHTHDIEDLTTGLGTDGQVWTKGAGAAMGWDDATGGGVADAFASVENSAGVEQFAATGAAALRFTAGADIGITFDAGDNEIIIAFTGSVTGITRGYADITGDTGASAAVGADTLIVTGAGGISTTSSSAPDTLTITLGNHSAALLTTGTLLDARIQASGVTQHQASITGLGTIATGVWNGTAIGPTYGGTGITTYSTGDILYASAANTLAKRAATTDGFVLTLAAGIPSWAAPAGGSPFIGAQAYHNAAQSIANATEQKVLFNTEVFDTAGAFASSTYTVGTAGKWLITTTIPYGDYAGGVRQIKMKQAGAFVRQVIGLPATAAGGQMFMLYEAILICAVSDTLEIWTQQSSGGAINVGGDATVTFAFLGAN